MKKSILFLLFIGFPWITQAQEIVWQNTIGGNGGDNPTTAEQTMDGGYIIGGHSNSYISGDKNENSNGLSDYWIVKLDAGGNITWQNTIGGSKDDYLHCTRQTTDGGYILGGQSLSGISGDKTEDSIGYYDFWIIKTDSTGNILWQNTIGGTQQDYLFSIIPTFDNGYLIGGYSESNISGDKNEDSFGTSDYWIVKLNSTGNIEWQRTLGGYEEDYCSSIIQTSDSGYVIAGNSRSGISGNKTVINKGSFDYWLLKIDAAGMVQWQKSIGGSADDVLKSITLAPDQGFVLSGFSGSDSSGDKTENKYGLYDIWVVKTDSTGNILWQKTIGGTDYDHAANAYATADGNYIVGGQSDSYISGNKQEKNVGSKDYWILKLNPSGQILWQNSIGGYYSEYANHICQTDDGDHLIVGGSDSWANGDKTEPRFGTSFDFWIVKVSGKSNAITGEVFADFNVNNIHDSLDMSLSNRKVVEMNTNRFTFTNEDGYFNMYVNDTASYLITPHQISYYSPSPITHAAQFSTFYQVDSLNDFALQPGVPVNDLCVNITPITPFRSGFNASYLINYSNSGTTVQNAIVVYYPDTGLSYVSSTLIPGSVTPDSLIFYIGNLAPFQSGQIQIDVNVHLNKPIGELINSGAAVFPIAGDANPACNYSWWEVFVTGSFDPNDIIVNREFIYTTELPNPPYLEYVIRFQNTGNDTAFNVTLLNPIDTSLFDLSTLEFVASPHPVDMRFIYFQKNLEFRFNNILLADSVTNEPKSHGFVRYRIKPKSNLTAFTSIFNFAFIYFDFNQPVNTNWAETQIILPSALNEITVNHFTIQPNPVRDIITVTLKNSDDSTPDMELYSIHGQLITALRMSNRNMNSLHHTFDVSFLPAGVYFLKIGNQTSRMIKL